MLARIPLGRMGEVKEIAAAVSFLSGDQAAYNWADNPHKRWNVPQLVFKAEEQRKILVKLIIDCKTGSIESPASNLGTIRDVFSMSNVEERAKKLICEQLGVKEEEVSSDASFVLGADSLDTVELVMALEEEFETEIPDEEAEKITTVKEAIDYILAHQ